MSPLRMREYMCALDEPFFLRFFYSPRACEGFTYYLYAWMAVLFCFVFSLLLNLNGIIIYAVYTFQKPKKSFRNV